ncbi:hypothetical protein THASP1DRAFT_27055 [Thamnocephalis sphaerospora]|uniref:TRAPP trafficking subunit Trs65-domain-containing protein n=1 Tax=Thamnocephalis sphaerospora TaxID=78915 RepID=A0A4P9XXS1_9FUNG|nr:hypothetical protein THASP1DRAFT_27055 [Thamnocephalis sphaerospora]|eukprot:RKP11137.1 hypothetical protein THASP1DRAFT_27055 [Thamnocephalis sphaerospora]
MDPLDGLFQSSSFDVFIPALKPPEGDVFPQLDDLLLAHELDYALLDETLDVYVMARVRLSVDNARGEGEGGGGGGRGSHEEAGATEADTADDNDKEPRVPMAVQELFNSLRLQLEATVIEMAPISSPVLGPDVLHGGQSPMQRPVPQRSPSPIPPVPPLPQQAQPPQSSGAKPQMRLDTSGSGLLPPASHASTPTSPALGPSQPQRPARLVPRRSSSIRGDSLSPGLGPRRGSDVRQTNEGWSGTQIYQERRAAREGPISTVQMVNETWCCAFKFAVPIAYTRLNERSRSLIVNVVVTKERSSLEAQLADMSITLASPGTGGGADVSVLEEFAQNVSLVQSPSHSPVGSVDLATPDTPKGTPSINGAQTPSKPRAEPFSPSREELLRRTASKTMPVRTAAIATVKATWTSLLENTLILAVEFENEPTASHDFTLEALDIGVDNAVLCPYGDKFSDHEHVLLRPSDQFSTLYHLTVLEDDQLPPIQPPPVQVMSPTFARFSINGEPPMLFTPAQPESKLRSVRLQVAGHVHTTDPDMPTRTITSDWSFSVDASDVAKRRVQEQFRSGGARTVRVFPPAETSIELGPPRTGRPAAPPAPPQTGNPHAPGQLVPPHTSERAAGLRATAR